MKIVTAVACLLLGLNSLLFTLPRSMGEEINSFWDIVRNPDAMPDLDQYHAEVERAAQTLSRSPDDVAKLVDHFVFEAKSTRDAWTELRILEKLGDKAYPRALEILRNPSMRERLTILVEGDESNPMLPEGPINRLCEIFDQETPPPLEAAALLSPFLQSESEQIRKSIAIVIGSIASTDSMPDLRRALTDKEAYVRSYALMGIQRAISGGRIDESAKEKFFALVADMWPSDTEFVVCDSIPVILLHLDRDRGIEYLLAENLFTVQFRPLWRILEAFNAESVEVPRERIITIIEDANKEPLKYPIDHVLQQALPLLGAHRNEEDLALIEHYLDDNNEWVIRGATDALYRFHQYSERIRDPREFVKKHGWDTLTRAEKHILAIEELDAEVKNGGFAQYYFNSSSDHWQDALSGLEAIGAGKRNRVMSATIAKFGEAKPAADRNNRTSRLAQVVRNTEDPFHEQDRAWYAIKDENLDKLILKYNLANLESRLKAESTKESSSK